MLGLPALWWPPVPLSLPVSEWPAWAQFLVCRPDQGLAQPIHTWWTSAWLHGSDAHRAANLGALLLLAIMGGLTAPPRGATLAWMLAWPLTQLGLLLQPDPIAAYVGLSGVLHAGLVVVSLHALAANRPRFPRGAAALLLLGVVAKLIMENPFAHRLVQPPGSDITVVPWVHLSGVVAGLLCALLARLGRPFLSNTT